MVHMWCHSSYQSGLPKAELKFLVTFTIARPHLHKIGKSSKDSKGTWDYFHRHFKLTLKWNVYGSLEIIEKYIFAENGPKRVSSNDIFTILEYQWYLEFLAFGLRWKKSNESLLITFRNFKHFPINRDLLIVKIYDCSFMPWRNVTKSENFPHVIYLADWGICFIGLEIFILWHSSNWSIFQRIGICFLTVDFAAWIRMPDSTSLSISQSKCWSEQSWKKIRDYL